MIEISDRVLYRNKMNSGQKLTKVRFQYPAVKRHVAAQLNTFLRQSGTKIVI